MITKETILNLVKAKGPLIPINITKELGGNTIFVGAILSELSSSKQIIVSTLKIGGSPLYYVSGQESKLQNFSNYLNEKDRRTFDLLADKKILRDNTQTPLIQVSLRAIKDFAKPLQVKVNGQDEIFWKWYLLTDSQAVEFIKDLLGARLSDDIAKPNVEEKSNSTESNLKNDEKTSSDKKEELMPEQASKNLEKTDKNEDVDENKIDNDTNQEKLDENSKNNSNSYEQNIEKKDDDKKDVFNSNNYQKKISENYEKKSKNSKSDDFLDFVEVYLEKNNIDILKKNIDKKNKEITFELLVPSQFGSIKFFSKAIKKSKISDSDISKIFVQSNIHKLPTIVLISGDLTKKAKDILETFTNFIIKKID